MINKPSITSMNFKNIHIGHLIRALVTERGIALSRICVFMKCSEKDIVNMYAAENLSTDLLLRWSKLLEYDFFRIYSQHLILYAPPVNQLQTVSSTTPSVLPQFRKSIYTKEVIDFILEQISTEAMTKTEVMARYKIPKTTLYRWISKYQST